MNNGRNSYETMVYISSYAEMTEYFVKKNQDEGC